MPTNAMPHRVTFDRAPSNESEASRPSVDLGVSLNNESRQVFFRMASAEGAVGPSSGHGKLQSPAQTQVAARKAMFSKFANMFKF